MTPLAATLLTTLAAALVILLGYRDLIQQRRIHVLHARLAELESEVGRLAMVEVDNERLVKCIATLEAALAEAWEPVSTVRFTNGDDLHVDEIGLTVGRGNKALITGAWPEDGHEYAICQRRQKEQAA